MSAKPQAPLVHVRLRHSVSVPGQSVEVKHPTHAPAPSQSWPAPHDVPALRLSPEADLPLGLMSWLAPRGDAEGRALLAPRGLDPLARRASELKTITTRRF